MQEVMEMYLLFILSIYLFFFLGGGGFTSKWQDSRTLVALWTVGARGLWHC